MLTIQALQRLKVCANRRFLVKEDGSLFFWLGDTAWELFHKLDREEAELYLNNRAKLGFNVIHAVGLAEMEGVTTDNAHGRRPLKTGASGRPDPAAPDTDGHYDKWSHVDYIVDLAATLGLYIAFLPTWGDKYHKAWGKGPEIFDPVNAKIFGQWLGSRYKHKNNIIWVLGGDRPLTRRIHFEVVKAMAEGLAEGDGGSHLRTFHPPGEKSSSYFVHDETWLDFNMIQSGHGIGGRANYLLVEEDYSMLPVKPTLDGEPCYEDHPISFKPNNGYYDATDIRIAAYYAVFAGAFGHSYGHHSIWSMTSEPGDYFIMDWRSALERPGAKQMQHLRALMESRSFLDRIPDQGLIANNRNVANYMSGTRGDCYAMIYSPNGLRIDAVMGRIEGERVTASWYNPRTGLWTEAGEFDNMGKIAFQPPTSGRGEDWILVLDS
jgi:hypothetical protein